MKIWGDNPRVFGIYNQPNTVGKVNKPVNSASKKDEYTISRVAKEYQTALKALQNIPDIRQGKVNEISDKIEKGQYRVSAQDIADKIIGSLSAE
jgi:negative regulator of flagellin synthesis FlgM